MYQIECPECKSVLQFCKAEINNLHITCPVCGVSTWADTTVAHYEWEDEDQ